MKKAKWLALGAMLSGGVLLNGGGCLQAFWNGLWNQGFPGKAWIDITLGILYESIVG
jgi:hypothetical protein